MHFFHEYFTATNKELGKISDEVKEVKKDVSEIKDNVRG